MLERSLIAGITFAFIVAQPSIASANCEWDIQIADRDLRTIQHAAPLALDPNLPLQRQSTGETTSEELSLGRVHPVLEQTAIAHSQLQLARQRVAIGDREGCAEAVAAARDALTTARSKFR